MIKQHGNKLAFKKGSEKRLEVTVKEWEGLKKLFEEKQIQLAALEDTVWDLKSREQDIVAQEKELEILKEEVENLGKNIIALAEKKEELKRIVQGYASETSNVELMQLYLREMAIPSIKGIQAINAVGIRAGLEENIYESFIFMKMHEGGIPE